MVVRLTDEDLLLEAVGLARSVDLAHDRNPRVGALVVRDGEVVGRGWHRGSGTPHAEVDALADAGSLARGATIYVTLEPCNGVGRTGPCVDALREAGIARVVFGQADPNPVMAGGAARLAATGVTVDRIDSAECLALNPSWTFAHTHGRPWVVWKTATSLDGYISGGPDRWITGEESRAEVQRIRATVGAIVTGTGTVLADNPAMTVRGADTQPLRVVVGKREVPDDFAIHPCLRRSGPLRDVLTMLWSEHGVHRILVEAGRDLSTSLWREGLVDEVYWFTAPTLLGGGVRVLGETVDLRRFHDVDVRRVGWDVLTHFRTA